MSFINRAPTPLKLLTLTTGIIAALLITLYVLGQIWISTDHGQNTIKSQITQSLKTSGLSFEAEAIRWSFPATISLASLKLSDHKGSWLEAEQLRATLSPDLNLMENIILDTFSANTLQFMRTPELAASENQDKTPATPNITFNNINIKRFELDSQLTQLPETLEISLLANAKLDASEQKITFKSASNIVKGLPEKISGTLAIEGTFNLNNEILIIESAELKSDAATLNANATLNIPDNTLESSGNIIITDLTKWHKDINGSVTLNNTISGTLDALVLSSKGTLNTFQYDDMTLATTALTFSAAQKENAWHGDLAAVSNDENIRLSTQYHYQSNVLNLTQISGNVYDNTAKGNLSLNLNNSLAQGTLKVSLPALSKLSDILSTPIKGTALTTINLTNDNKKQSLTFTAHAQNLSAPEHKLGVVKADISGSIPDLHKPMPQQLRAKLHRLNYNTLLITQMTSDVTYNDAIWHLNLNADVKTPHNIHLSTQANIKNPETTSWDIAIANITGTWENVPFKSLTPIKIASNKNHIEIAESKLKLGNAPITLRYKQSETLVDAALSITDLKPYPLYPGQPYAFKEAKADISSNISGSPKNPIMANHIRIRNIHPNDMKQRMSLNIESTTKDKTTQLSAETSGIESFTSSLNMNVPTTFSLNPQKFTVDSRAPITGNLKLASNLSLLVGLAATPEHEASGPIKGNMTLSGNVETPKLNGEITISNGQYKYLPLGTILKNIDTTITAKNNTIRIKSFSAQDDEKNPIKASGFVTVEGENAFNYALNLSANNVHLLKHPNIQGFTSLDVKATGNSIKGQVGGDIITKNIDIYLPSQFATSVKKLNIIKSIPSIKKQPSDPQDSYPLIMDINVVVDQGVYVRGQGLNTELEGKLHITGNVNNPEVNGSLNTKRGRYEQFGKQFKLKKASLTFKGEIPPSPYLDVIASNKNSGVEVMPVITGPVLKPTLKITSSPSMPEEEALSVLLFGKDSKSISPLQAAQLASSIAKLSGHIQSDGFNPLGTARDILGVDDINVGGGDNAAETTVGVGKYLADDVYLELERGAQNSSGKASIEVNVLPNISVQSSTGATGDNSVGVNWKYDY